MSFCWLPPDSGAGEDVDARGAHVVLLDDPLGVGAGAGPVDPRTRVTFGALGLVAEDPVLPQRRVEQQAVPVPVLGDVADAAPRGAAGWTSR